MPQVPYTLCLCITTAVFCRLATVISSSTVHAGQRKDVIGQYRLSNEYQCRRLCWYSPLCLSYSYHADASISALSCVLHTKPVNTIDENTVQSSPGWTETETSGAHINNGCKLRPCNQAEVCIPTSSPHVKTSSISVSYICLPLPSKCGDPEAPVNGDVIVSGSNQDDVAHVTCDDGYIALPRGVTVELSCLVTSKWTSFEGECSQYAFNISDKSVRYNLLWNLTEDSALCAKGVYTDSGRMVVRLRQSTAQENDDVQVLFRYNHYQGNKYHTDVVWSRVVDNKWDNRRNLGDMPLVPGDSFNLTLHVQSDRLQLVLNEAHVYTIPMGSVQDNPSGIDVSNMNAIAINGEVKLTYINLISGC